MKNTKRAVCLLLAVIVMFATMGLVTSIAETTETASTGTTVETATEEKKDAEYFTKFTADQGNKFLTCDEMAELLGDEAGDSERYATCDYTTGTDVVYNSDGSMTLSKDMVNYSTDSSKTSYQLGANLEVPVTDEMKENYLKATDGKLIVSYYLSEAIARYGNTTFDADCYVRVYAKFKEAQQTTYTSTTGVTSDKNTKLVYAKIVGETSNSDFNTAIDKYEQTKIDKTFVLVDVEGNTLPNLDVLDSIVISLYHYSARQATVEFSGIAYSGSPAYKEFVAPEPDDTEATLSFTDWSQAYDKKWADAPSRVAYSNTEDGATFDTSTYNGLRAGWIYMKQNGAVTTSQRCQFYNFNRDAFNKAIVTANQPGGSGKAQITVNLDSLTDTNGAKMAAEFQVMFSTYSGESVFLKQEWINSGERKNFTLDLKDFTTNSVRYVKISFMNFWRYCEADGKYYDPTEITEGENAGKHKCSDGTFVTKEEFASKTLTYRTMNKMDAFVSPMYTVPGSGTTALATTQTTATTTSSDGDYEYAGYHFYDFTSEALNETYGNAPEYVNFLDSDSYHQYGLSPYSLNGKNYNGFLNNNSAGTKITGDATYLKDYQDALDLMSGGYQVEMASPTRTRNQHQISFFPSGEKEDKERVKTDSNDHPVLETQNEKYDYYTQMENALKYSKEHPNGNLRGYLAVDVYLMSCIHGYKNTQNATYKAWCAANGVACKDEVCSAELMVNIQAQDADKNDMSVTYQGYVNVGKKTTVYIDISDLVASQINSVRLVTQNYANLANKEQGGDNHGCGIKNIQTRYSAIYVPGNKNSDHVTTVIVTQPLNMKDANRIKKLFDALPGLTVDDYETEADYKKLTAFLKAYDNSSQATKDYLAEKYDITNDLYIELVMLEQEVYDKIYLNGGGGGEEGTYSTGDIAFPVMSVLVAGLAAYVVIRTRKRKA